SRIVPGTVLDYDVLMDAVVPRFSERPVGDLKHADGARRGSVHLEWIPTESPTPVSSGHRIAAAFDLGERREQFRCDDCGGVLDEERAVFPPGLSRRLGE